MRKRGNVGEGARECSRGGEGTFVRDEGTFARGDLQGHRRNATFKRAKCYTLFIYFFIL